MALAAAILVGPWASVASAHAGLVGTDPADGSRLAENPGSVTFRFNEDISVGFADVSLLDGTGNATDLPVSAAGPTAIRARLDGSESGRLRLSFRVTSSDGHPIAGDLSFVVREAATSDDNSSESPSPSPEETEPTTAAPPGTSAEGASTGAPPAGGGSDGPLFLGAGGLGLAMIAGLVIALRRVSRVDG